MHGGSDHPSEHLVEQRLRNRVIEALEALADGDDGVMAVGFFDVIEDNRAWNWREWSCLTSDEVTALDMRSLLVAARDATNTDPNGTWRVHRDGIP